MAIIKVSHAVREEMIALHGSGRKAEARALALHHGLSENYPTVLFARAREDRKTHTPSVRKKWARAIAVGPVIA